MGTYQRRRKDFLMGGGTVCSTGHIVWAWHRVKIWGGGGGAHAPGAPLVPTPMHIGVE